MTSLVGLLRVLPQGLGAGEVQIVVLAPLVAVPDGGWCNWWWWGG